MPTLKGVGLALGLLLPLLSLAASTTTSTVAYEYDPANGLLLSQSLNPDTAQANVKTAYTYDSYGNRLTTTVSSAATGQAAIPTRTVQKVTYDQYGLAPVSYTNALGQQSNVSYDPSNLPLYVDSLNGLRSTWVYDGFGRPTQETKPDGNITRWTYSMCVQATPCTLTTAKYFVQQRGYAPGGSTENAPMVKTYYDALSRVVRTETIGFDGASVITQDTEYDNLGRVYRSSRPYYAGQPIQWTVFSYDLLGRTTDVMGPDGAHTRNDYNGLVTTETNPLGQTRSSVKNSQGQLVQVTDANSSVLSYLYDANGNLIQTTDPQGNVTTYTYDALNHKLTTSDPDLGTWNYVYDVLGELVQQTDPKGQVTTMTYDLRGRVTNRSEPDLKSNWTYDSCTMGKGRLCQATADNGYLTSQVYDNQGRPTTTNTTIGTVYGATTSYDTNGRVLNQSYPTGLTLKYVYTALGYLKEVRNNSSNVLYWQANAMDAEGHLTQQTYGNNVVTQQVFDRATGRTQSITAGTNNAVQNLSFTYDLRGNLLTRGDANQSLSETFLYDSLNRLTSNTVNSGGAGVVSQTYGYDSIGNVTSRSDMGTYTYGSTNSRPHAVDRIFMTDGSIRQYSYDSVGNLTQEVQRDALNNVIAAKGRTETWTSFNMPLTLASPTSTATFVYGPDHQRIKMTADGTTTTYLNPDSAGGLLYEKDVKSDGTIEHRHFVTAGGGVVALIKQIGTGTLNVLYMHRDHLGSTTAITNASGTVIERMAYEPFGKRRTPAGVMDPANTLAGLNTDRGYTNHEHLDGLDLIHMNGRVYDPATGRFISADPNVPYPTDIQSYNRYSYTRNNPLVMIDPSGFTEFDYSYSITNSISSFFSLSGRSTTYTESFNYDMKASVVYHNATWAKTATGIALGSVVGAGAGAAISAGCDFMSAMLCAPLNPQIVSTGALVGGLIGGIAGSDRNIAAPFLTSAIERGNRLLACGLDLGCIRGVMANGNGTNSVPPVPGGYIGDQSDPRAGTSNNGKRHTSGPLTPGNGGTGDAQKDFDKLTGGTGRPFPDSDGRSKIPGALVGDNGIWIRPGTKNPGDGPRIEIPGNDNKLPETLHY